MKTKYVIQLPEEMRNEIYKDVRNALYKLGLRGSEWNEAIETAMDSRLCDLEETIDIKKYLFSK